MTWKPTPVGKSGAIPAAALGILVGASANTTRAAGVDAAGALLADAALNRYPEAAGATPVPAPRSVKFSVARNPAADALHAFSAGDALQPPIPATLHYGAGSNLTVSSERASQTAAEVLLRNPDALVRAKVRLTLSNKWVGFVYADLGALDSSLKWQGMAGLRGGHGVDLLGGWRHVTYHFGRGMGCDSLDFNGPFLGATLAW